MPAEQGDDLDLTLCIELEQIASTVGDSVRLLQQSKVSRSQPALALAVTLAGPLRVERALPVTTVSYDEFIIIIIIILSAASAAVVLVVE